MKNTILCFFFMVVLLTSCNNQKNQQKGATSATDTLINTAGANVDSAYQNGARLIAASDCLTCHRLEQKNNGPSYYEISERYHNYEGTVENLAHSIIYGSKGLWGNNAMTPHPNLTFAEAKEMAMYILSLKNVPSTNPESK